MNIRFKNIKLLSTKNIITQLIFQHSHTQTVLTKKKNYPQRECVDFFYKIMIYPFQFLHLYRDIPVLLQMLKSKSTSTNFSFACCGMYSVEPKLIGLHLSRKYEPCAYEEIWQRPVQKQRLC